MPGTGSIKETATGSGKWRLRVYAGRDNKGNVKHINRTVTGSKRVAQAELAKVIADLGRGTLAASHPTTVSELLDRWLKAVEHDRTAQTMKGYRRLAEANIAPALGQVQLDRLTGAKIDAFYASLTARGLSPASVRRHHALLHVAFGRAVKWGVITTNPSDKATPPPIKRTVAQAPSVATVQQLLEAAAQGGDPVLTTAVALGAVTGCRRGELCALRWSDVDWERGALRVARSLAVIKGVASEGPTKTHSHRYIAIDDKIRDLLARRRAEQEACARQIGTTLAGDGYVLSRAADGSLPCLPDGLSHSYKRLVLNLGHDGHFHELRHFAATTAISSGVDVGTVAGRLGHADASVTLRVYAHALEARDRDLAGLLGRAVLGGTVPQDGRTKDEHALAALRSTA